ncbi:DMT family transporter [Simkania sp.]|uniref:DMT family transporter n=1 Tax=Simkania sp. TaxID=34094 RepID=UPI003B51DF6E
MKHQNLSLAIFLTIVTWFLMAVLTALAKVCSSYETAPTILFFQYFVTLILILPFALRTSLKTQHKGPIILRSLFGVGEYALLFFAITSISLAGATVLLNAGVLFIPFILLFWLKIKISHKLWFPLVVGFVGVYCVLNPDSQTLHYGAILAIIAGFCMALTMVSLKKLSDEPSIRIIFYYVLLGTLVLLPYVIWTWHPIPWSVIGLMAVIGVIFAIIQYTFTVSFKFACPASLAPFSYTYVVFSGLFDWLFWHHVPPLLSWIGIALIIGGGIWVLYLEKDF